MNDKKFLNVTIVNDEKEDKGAVTIEVMDSKGKVFSTSILDEKGQDEFTFDRDGYIVISAAPVIADDPDEEDEEEDDEE